MSVPTLVPLGELIHPANERRCGDAVLPIASVTRGAGLVPQSNIFKKRIAGDNLAGYRVVSTGQLAVGIHVDEGAIGISSLGQDHAVSPAYSVWSIRDSAEVWPAFLDRFVRSPRAIEYFISHYRQTADRRGKLTRERFLSLPVPLPPLAQQKRIADILDQVDALRAKRRAALYKLDALTQAIFIDLFGDPTDIEHEHSWEPLGRSLLFVTSGSRGWARYYAHSGTRFIRSVDVRMNRISDDAAVFVNPPESAEARRTRVECGDVLLTITGSRIGRVAPVTPEFQGAYVSQHVAILRLDPRLTPEFVSFFLALGSGGQRQIAKTQYGQTKPGLNLDQIRQLKLPVAPFARQAELRRRLSAARRVESDNVNSLAQLDILFASLQHRAFRGEL